MDLGADKRISLDGCLRDLRLILGRPKVPKVNLQGFHNQEAEIFLLLLAKAIVKSMMVPTTRPFCLVCNDRTLAAASGLETVAPKNAVKACLLVSLRLVV